MARRTLVTYEGMTRRRTLGVLAASLALAACRATGDAAVLKVASQKGGTKSLMLASGVLADAPYRVEWAEFPAAQHLLEALGSGAVDVGLAGDAPFQFAYQSGSPIKAIGAQLASPRPSDALAVIVPARSPLRTFADLKGRSIATTRGSVGHYLVLRALDRAGMPLDSVRFSWLAPGDAKAAFDSGAVDAWSIWVPYLAAAQLEQARILVDGRNLVKGYGFEIAHEGAIARKRALLVDFAAREARALAWLADHRDDFATVLARETGLPIEIARITAQKNLRLPVPVGAALIADQEIVLETFRKAGDIGSPRPIADAFADIGRG